jgi:hypothetical protein
MTAMSTIRAGALLLATTTSLALLSHTSPADAAEQILRFKLVTQGPIGGPGKLPEVAGHTVTAGQYTGVALFEDGRVATKRFVDVSDDTADSGSFKGYSTYTFQNGDSLTLSYTGGWGGNGAVGAYKVVSGTGAFSGATGTGEFKSVDAKWDQAFLWDASFTLTFPTQ